jgi:carboxyl-terminal processing protease
LFDRIAQTIQDHFYEPSLRGVDWPGLRARLRPVAARAQSDQEFARAASQLLQSLRASHLDLMLPASRSGALEGIGIGAEFERIEDQWIATRVASLSDARRKGIAVGDRLLANAVPPGPAGTIAALRLQTCRGEERGVQVRRESVFWPPERPTFRWSRIDREKGRSIGYLRVDGFEDDGAPMADRAMADLADADALIIDLRFNPGGNASALRLASYFTDGAGPALAILTRDWLLRLKRALRPADVIAAPRLDRAYTTDLVFKGLSDNGGGAMLWTEDVGERRWRKPVVVLIGAGSGSAAEGFGWLMKLRTHALFVGRDTAGALLGSQVFDVGLGWSLRVPVHGIWAPNGQDYGDRPVPPDVRVERTREALCQGRDLDIEAAVDAIEQGRAKATGARI